MELIDRKKGKKWTKEEVIQCARLCSSRNEFKHRFQAAYSCSLRNGWRDEACSHMVPTRKPAGYWTEDKCIKEAQRYNNRTDFSKQSSSAHNAAFLNGWLEKCYLHMEVLNIHWTKEMCRDEALKYDTKKDWREKSEKSYNVSCRNGWVSEISLHLKNAYRPINYWTKHRCKEEALLFKTKTEWEKKSVCSYRAANKNGWYSECCQHMSTDRYRGRNYWTLEKVLECSLLCKTRTEFQETYKSAYQAAQKNRWFDIIYSHMETIQAPSGTWTKENCIKEAQKI